MKTVTPNQVSGKSSSIAQRRFGKVSIRSTRMREMAGKNNLSKQKYTDWSPPMNIVQGLDYLKVELAIPGISKNNFKICCSGILLWMKIKKESSENGSSDIFYRTFILPENMGAEGITAVYEQNEKLVITIPKKKHCHKLKRLIKLIMKENKASGKTASGSMQLFLNWFDQRCMEHQLELAEFIGYFCYKPLYMACKSVAAKIFAFKEYLVTSKDHPDSEAKILQLINDIIEFIIDTNAAATNKYFNREELMNELPGISSLKSINEQPERNRKWLFTYQQWQRFRTNFPFLRDNNSWSHN